VDASAPCLVEVHGESSRNPSETPKHSFKVKFRRKAGAPKFSGEIFQPGTGHGDHDSLILKSPSGDDWATQRSWQADGASYIRDEWVASCHSLFSGFYPDVIVPRHRWVHLYLNGYYWGIYDLAEEPDADYLERRSTGVFVGPELVYPEADEFDIIKDGKVESGTGDAWYDLTKKAWELREGVRNGALPEDVEPLMSEIEALLDVDQFFD
jgi:hypothetical protein